MEEGVLVLTDDNFDEELAKHENLLVEFYAPWCGHCKKLAPEYAGAAEVLAKNDPPMFVAKVDSTVEKTISEKFGIQGFPTLIFFKNGERVDYNGGRTKDAIVEWILKKSGPPSTEVTCALLKEKAGTAKFMIAYFGAETEALYTDVHVSYATTEDKIQFVHNNDADCAKEYSVTAPGLVFFRQFEEKQVAYTGKADKDALVDFVKPLMVPTVFSFSEDEIEAVFGQQQETLILFRADEDKDAKFMKTFEDAAKDNKGKMLFSFSGVEKGIQEKLAEFMGVTKADLPTLRAIIPADMKKFASDVAPADHTSETIGKFIADVKSGAIKPHLKSEPIPEKQEGPVTVVVGKSFDDIVKDTTKDVLVKFYAPWCGHCKKLAPIWDELAEAYKDNDNLVIAKFDSTVNEADGVEIRGYPTLKFYPKDNKDGVDYDGDRDLESFKKWLSEKSTVLAGNDAAKSEL